jgi:magnesium transporter
MITIYKTIGNRLETIAEPVNNCWIDVVDPTQQEIDRLVEMGLPKDYITYPLDMDERARAERDEDGTLFMLIRAPYFQGVKVDVPYITIPMGVITTSQFIVTICTRTNEVLQEFAAGRTRNLEINKRNRFILRLLLATANRYLSYLREIDHVIDVLEDQLQLSQPNRELLELLKYQKTLVYFTTALKSDELLMERMQRWQFFHMYADDVDLLEDVITENQQAIEMTNISTNILSQDHGRLRLDHIQQPQCGDEVFSLRHYRDQPADDRVQLFWDERRPALPGAGERRPLGYHWHLPGDHAPGGVYFCAPRLVLGRCFFLVLERAAAPRPLERGGAELLDLRQDVL